LAHKVEVGGKEYEYKRPVLALERKARIVAKLISEKIADAENEETFGIVSGLWREAVQLMIQNPDEAILDLGNVTSAELWGVFEGFFVAAQTKNEKPPAG
jgi:hypothetical protein